LLRALYKRIDEGVGDVTEHRPHGLLDQPAGKFVVHVELDLAGRVAQRGEIPGAVEMGERPVGEADQHVRGIALLVRGTEVGLDAVVIDVQGGLGDRLVAGVHFTATAPW